MPDSEKVIKGLECCLSGQMKCDNCPYKEDDETTVPTCVKNLRNQAVELLKKQEPKRMRLCNGELCCPQCGAICKSYYHYCDECGQAVKWDE